jgi:two-component system, NarL family, sensor histidine kinase DesK
VRPTPRQAWWLLVVLHVPIVAVPVSFTWFGVVGLPGHGPLVATVLGVAMGTLQLRHSLAAARDVRPRGWVWTLVLLLALVYLPPWLLGWGQLWQGAQYCAAASAVMLLRGWPRIAVGGAMVVFSVGWELLSYPPRSVFEGVYSVSYAVFALVPSVILYLAVLLVRVLADVAATRAELAEAAVGRERLRLSRDLHDLFGQSLSAISLKGDLALRLAEPRAARAEVTGLTDLARDTLRRMRAITRDEHAVSLDAELEGAAALLGTAGVHAVIEVDPVSPAAQQVFAWAVREGVANVLRHSAAKRCSITVTRAPGTARLEIVNDRVRARATTGGRGLGGLAARAEAVGGSVRTGVGSDRFRLVVEVPEEAM